MFMKKLIVLMFIICLLISMVGCGGVPTTPPISSELVLVRVTDPESNLIFVAGKENEDVMVILGEKDTEGNPTSITGAVYVLEQGVSFAIEAGIDGLPIFLIDSEGNKVFFENYTNSMVDVSIYDYSESLIQDTTTINVDPADLLELKQLYDSFYSKQRWSTENTLFALKWGSVGLSVVGCISAGGLTIFSGGALTPVAAFACGKALLSTIAAFTPNDIDNAFSMATGAGSCLVSGFTVGCDSTALSIIAWAIEEGGGTNHTPIITSTPVTSATKDEPYSYDVNATDSNGDALTYSLTTKPTGMTINSSTGMINWTPAVTGDFNVSVKVSDGELFTPQSFTITVQSEVPNISGNWSGNYSTNLISGDINFVNITQSAINFSGTYNDSLGTVGTISGEYNGNAFDFTMTQTNSTCSGSFNGTAYINGNTLTFTFAGYNCLGTHENGTGTLTR